MRIGRKSGPGGRSRPKLRLLLAAGLAAGLLAACGTSTASTGTVGSGADGTSSTAAASSSAAASRPAPIIYRPAGLSMSTKVPLLVALYGTFGSPQDMEGLSHFEKVAGEHGFVVAYLGSSDPNHPWKPPSDLNYISAMIDQITAGQNIDPQRVYVTGFSAGGYETWRAGCQLSGKVAAIAIVSGAMNQALFDSCSPQKPVSQLLMVGTADGTRWTGVPGRLPSAGQTTAKWRSLDGCSATAAAAVAQVATVAQATWGSCADGSAVALYSIPGAGHVWPPYGSGAPPNYPASEEIWSFLSAHQAAPLNLSSADVKLLSLHATRTGRRRVVVAKFRVGEPLTIAATVGSAGRRLATRTVKITNGPLAQLSLSIATRFKGGRYSASFAIQDSYGRKLTTTRTVRVPGLAAAKKHH